MSSFGERIAKLSPEARAILERRLKEKKLALSQPAVPFRPAEGPVPLSFAQQRLWILDRLEPGRPLYNVPQAFRLRGRLDVVALRRSLDAICDRHEVLRTTFPAVEGRPIQVVASRRGSSQSFIDLTGAAETDREAEALRRCREEARKPFDLAAEFPMRAALIRLNPDDHVLLVTIHHIAFDEWSAEIFDRELTANYAAYLAGAEPRLAPLCIQYRDFAVRQRELLAGKVLEKQLSYWKKQLENVPPFLTLSSSRPRPSEQTFEGATETTWIRRPLTERIRTLGQHEGATPFMTLLAAFGVLLFRYSGQDDLVVGSPVAGRTRSDIEGLIGFFLNTLAFRIDLSGDPTFRELLGRVRAVAIDAYAHQDLPFERLVEELNPDRTLARSPLVQIMMTVQKPPPPLRLAGLRVTPLALPGETAKFDLTASFEEVGKEILASFKYSTDLFDASRVRRMLSHLQVLVAAIADDPDRRLSQLPLLTGEERDRVLVAWNDTTAEYPAARCVHELFEEQVERSPKALAIRDRVEELTFRELNRRANQLAHFLRNRGVGPEAVVGICMERSARSVVALLGVLKAGGAYLPLDPSYPIDRLAFMLRDSGARVLLIDERSATRFADYSGQIVCLDRADFSAEPHTNPSRSAGPDNLAYVIYTSGSTGVPKGVEAIHRGCVNRFAWMWRTYPFAAGEVCCQKTAHSFVDSVWEIFGPLLQGIPNVVLPDDVVRDPRRLVESLAGARVTRIVLVPSLLRTLLEFGGDVGRRLPRLEWWFTSGETLPLSLYQRFRNAIPGAALINLYGSSEVSADVTFYDSRWGDPQESVPIGRPIANTQVYLLDESGQPVPIGVPGEIYVGGHGLARGYRNRPELTAERFLPDPFGMAGSRLFRTGDRGRYHSDGQIEYLGRRDHQVKLRGHRTELGEIESALAAHPAVDRTVAAVRDDVGGESCLIAYVVPRKVEPTAAELRGFLEKRLPAFMLPGTFVFLDALPLSPNGKIDRTALPAPDASGPRLENTFVAPRNEVEQGIARIWCEVLGIDSVGIHDNFFDFGGHSLLAVKLLAEIEKAFGRRVALATVFRCPTVQQLAEILRERRSEKRGSPSLVAVQPQGAKPPFFCVHDNTGIVYYRRLARALGPDQPFYGLQAQGLDGTRVPYETVEEMAAHYVREILEFQPDGPYYLGGYSFGGKVAFEMARQLHSQNQRVALLAFFDTSNYPLSPEPTALEFIRSRTHFHLASLKRFTTKQKISYLLRRGGTVLSLIVSALGRGYEAICHPLRRAQRRVLEANRRAAGRYVPRFYEGRATIFRALDRAKDFHNDRSLTDPQLGWRKLCGEGVDVHEVPGGHASILREDASIQALGAKLSECLRKARDQELRRTGVRSSETA